MLQANRAQPFFPQLPAAKFRFIGAASFCGVTKPLQLLALRGPSPQFDASKGAEGLPTRILVMPWGESQTSQGKVIVNETTVQQLAAYNASQNWDRPALDFEHNSVPGSPSYKGEPCKIAGYGTIEVKSGEGIYLLMSSWTDDGKAYAAGGHYGDLSPVVKLNANHEVIGCHSAALCRHGATPGLIFLSATSTTHDMTKAPQNADELFSALRSALGLSNEGTPTEVMTELTKRLAAPAVTTKKADAEKPDEVAALTAQVKELGDGLKALTSSIETSRRAEITAQCAREGKVIPEAAKDLPMDKFIALCAQLPVTVPLEQRSVEPLMLSGTAHVANPKLAAACGVSADDVTKYGDL